MKKMVPTRRRRRMMILVAVLACLVSCSWLKARKSSSFDTAQPAVPASPKNVILIVADGWGPEAAGFLIQYKRLVEKEHSIFEEISREATSGLVLTNPVDGLVAESASAASAYATGVKTYNQMLAISSDGRQVDTVLERAQAFGKAVGLVTTTRITHATTAAFAIHTSDRYREAEFAEKLLQKRITVLLGGGMGYFIPAHTDVSRFGVFKNPMQLGESKRSDERNLVDEAKRLGYRVVTDAKQLATIGEMADRASKALESDGTESDATEISPTEALKLIGSARPMLLGLFSASHLPYQIDRAPDDQIPNLTDMFHTSVRILGRYPAGYFLMVEAGKIDMAADEGDPGTLLGEMLEFEDLVKTAWSYSKTNPDTLLVITSDHDTGGMSFVSNASHENREILLSNERYKPTLVIPDAHTLEQIRGQQRSLGWLLKAADGDPNALFENVKKYTAYSGLRAADFTKVLNASDAKPHEAEDADASASTDVSGLNDGPINRLSALISGQLLLVWATSHHTHTPVLLYSTGPHSESFRGIQGNDDVGRHLIEAVRPPEVPME